MDIEIRPRARRSDLDFSAWEAEGPASFCGKVAPGSVNWPLVGRDLRLNLWGVADQQVWAVHQQALPLLSTKFPETSNKDIVKTCQVWCVP